VRDGTRAEPWLVIPVKGAQGAKQRLASVLPQSERELLSVTVSRRVLHTASEVWPAEALVVVTPDPEVAELCRTLTVGVLPDPGASQTEAVRLGVHHALERGARVVATLAADLPLLGRDDLVALLRLSRRLPERTMVLIPDLGGSGSNGMVVRPGAVLAHAFGPDSRLRHLRMGRALGLRTRELTRPGLAADLDRPRDLEELGGAPGVLAGAGRG
jgi:2-phospho-L-lactate guanylyltransferase